MEVFQLLPSAHSPTSVDHAAGKQARSVGLGANPIVAIFIGVIFWSQVFYFFLRL
jgi:hypothetical protein